MLNTLRQGAKSWVAKGLFLLLILSFAAWGIGDYLQPDPAGPVAEVGDLEISRDELVRDFNRELERMRQRFGDAIDRETAVELGLVDQLLGQAITRRLLDLEAREIGVRVSDDLVRQSILSEPAFLTATGQFDRARFEQTLYANGLSEEGFVSMMRGDLARGLVSETVTAGAAVPASLAKLLYADEAETRVAEIAFLPDEGAGTPPAPTEAELAEAYEKDKPRWMAPEYRAVTAVLLRPEDLMDEVQVGDDRLREAYGIRRAEFETAGTRNVSQLLFSDAAAADVASDRIAAGESFDAVAQDAVDKGAERTEIGTVTRDDLFPAAVADAAFSLPGEGTTEPVQSPLGWHLLHVADVQQGTTIPFEEVRDRLRDDIAREEAIDRLFEVGIEVGDALAGGASVEDVSTQFNLPLIELPPLSRQGQEQNGQRPAELPTLRGFLDAVFATSAGSHSDLVETPEGAYYVLRVDEVIEPRQRPLDEVKDQVAQHWRAERLHELGAARAEEMAEEVRGGAALTAVAEAAGVTARTMPPIQRSANAPGERMPATLVRKLFAAQQGDVVVDAMEDGHVVARLVEIRETDLAAAADELERAREELSAGMAVDIRTQYLEALRDRYRVTVDEAAVRSLF